jgi:hypothetical protein
VGTSARSEAQEDNVKIQGAIMIDPASKRGELIKHLEDAIAIADELDDGTTGYLIERALDEARTQYFRLPRTA